MSAGRFNMVIEQGTGYNKSFTLSWISSGNVVDLTSYKARLTVRARKDSSSAILSIDTDNDPTLIAIPTPANGVVNLTLSSSTTEALSFEFGYYDLELYTASVSYRVMEGTVRLSKEVSYA